MTLRQLLRKPFTNTPFTEEVNLSGKRAIVTGCGKGSLGYASAKSLAKWGAEVVITTRKNTEAIAQQLRAELNQENCTATVIAQDLDLSNCASVNAFSDQYLAGNSERLDILMNNAGVHLDLMSQWKTPKLSADGIEMQWRINYLGSVHLTHRLLPLLQKTGKEFGDTRIVNVGSQIYTKVSNNALFDTDTPYNSWQSYGLSKLGLIHFTRELHRRFNDSCNLKSYCLHPGAASGTSTGVANKGLEGHAVINFMRKLTEPLMNVIMTSPEEGAQTQLYCATADAASGQYYQDCAPKETNLDAQDVAAAERLWDDTQTWLSKVCH